MDPTPVNNRPVLPISRFKPLSVSTFTLVGGLTGGGLDEGILASRSWYVNVSCVLQYLPGTVWCQSLSPLRRRDVVDNFCLGARSDAPAPGAFGRRRIERTVR